MSGPEVQLTTTAVLLPKNLQQVKCGIPPGPFRGRTFTHLYNLSLSSPFHLGLDELGQARKFLIFVSLSGRLFLDYRVNALYDASDIITIDKSWGRGSLI